MGDSRKETQQNRSPSAPRAGEDAVKPAACSLLPSARAGKFTARILGLGPEIPPLKMPKTGETCLRVEMFITALFIIEKKEKRSETA